MKMFREWVHLRENDGDPAQQLEALAAQLERGIARMEQRGVAWADIGKNLRSVTEQLQNIARTYLPQAHQQGYQTNRGVKLLSKINQYIGQVEQVAQQHATTGAQVRNPAHQHGMDQETWGKVADARAAGQHLGADNAVASWQKNHGNVPQQVKGNDEQVQKWVLGLVHEIVHHIRMLAQQISR